MQRISINCCCETPSRVRRRPSPCAVLPYSPTHPTPTLPPGLRSHPAAPVPGSHSSAQPKAPTFPPASFLSGGFPRIRLWVPWVDAPPPSPGRDGGFPPGLPAPEVARFAGSDLLIRFEEQRARARICISAEGIGVEETTSSAVAPICSSAVDLEGLLVTCCRRLPEVY